MAHDGTPVRRCAPCDRDWPNVSAYNLCPRCQKCTFAHAVLDPPDYPKAKEDAARFKAIRDFDAKVDAGEILQVPADWVAKMEALLELTPSISDPPEHARDVRFHDHPGAKYPSPLKWDQDAGQWGA